MEVSSVKLSANNVNYSLIQKKPPQKKTGKEKLRELATFSKDCTVLPSPYAINTSHTPGTPLFSHISSLLIIHNPIPSLQNP
jgi:hypothetical protein